MSKRSRAKIKLISYKHPSVSLLGLLVAEMRMVRRLLGVIGRETRGTTKVTQVGKKIKKEDFTGVDIVRGDM